MNNYIAAFLNDNGALSVCKKSDEVIKMELGSFSSFEKAVESACDLLESHIIGNGVLHRDAGFGGFLICNEQEFERLNKEAVENAKNKTA
ncbi:hypothetical protein ACOLZ1_002869 [Vibrio fluvialis]